MLRHLAGDYDVWKKEFCPQFVALILEYSGDIDLHHIGLPENWNSIFSV